MNNRVLITGGGGYIGSALSMKLIRSGFSVTILDNFSKGTLPLFHERLNIVQGDIRSESAILKSLADNSMVIHLAGVSDGRAGRKSPETTFEINFKAFAQLLHLSIQEGVKRFINISTFGVYGTDYECELKEGLPVNPSDPYSLSKYRTEVMINSCINKGFTTLNLRLAMVYGISPNMRFDFLVNTLALHAFQRKEIIVSGGKQRRPQIHMEDLCDFLLELLLVKKATIAGKTLNLGAENPSVADIARTIQSNIPEKIKISYLEPRIGETSFILNSDSIYSILGKKPKKHIGDAVKVIYNYLKNEMD